MLWEEKEEEKKHLFVITEQDIKKTKKANGPSQSDLNRYQVV